MENAGRVVSQRDLLEQVWGREYIDDIYYPRVYISQLRRKIERDAGNTDLHPHRTSGWLSLRKTANRSAKIILKALR